MSRSVMRPISTVTAETLISPHNELLVFWWRPAHWRLFGLSPMLAVGTPLAALGSPRLASRWRAPPCRESGNRGARSRPRPRLDPLLERAYRPTEAAQQLALAIAALK